METVWVREGFSNGGAFDWSRDSPADLARRGIPLVSHDQSKGVITTTEFVRGVPVVFKTLVGSNQPEAPNSEKKKAEKKVDDKRKTVAADDADDQAILLRGHSDTRDRSRSRNARREKEEEVVVEEVEKRATPSSRTRRGRSGYSATTANVVAPIPPIHDVDDMDDDDVVYVGTKRSNGDFM